MPLYSGVLHIFGFDAFAWVWFLTVGEAMAQPWVQMCCAVSLIGTVLVDARTESVPGIENSRLVSERTEEQSLLEGQYLLFLKKYKRAGAIDRLG